MHIGGKHQLYLKAGSILVNEGVQVGDYMFTSAGSVLVIDRVQVGGYKITSAGSVLVMKRVRWEVTSLPRHGLDPDQ